MCVPLKLILKMEPSGLLSAQFLFRALTFSALKLVGLKKRRHRQKVVVQLPQIRVFGLLNFRNVCPDFTANKKTIVRARPCGSVLTIVVWAFCFVERAVFFFIASF